MSDQKTPAGSSVKDDRHPRECPRCGRWYSTRGIHAHVRACAGKAPPPETAPEPETQPGKPNRPAPTDPAPAGGGGSSAPRSSPTPSPPIYAIGEREAREGLGVAGEPEERPSGAEAAREAAGETAGDGATIDDEAAGRALLDLLDLACRGASRGAVGLDPGLRAIVEPFAGSLDLGPAVSSKRVSAVVVAGVAAIALVQAAKAGRRKPPERRPSDPEPEPETTGAGKIKVNPNPPDGGDYHEPTVRDSATW